MKSKYLTMALFGTVIGLSGCSQNMNFEPVTKSVEIEKTQIYSQQKKVESKNIGAAIEKEHKGFFYGASRIKDPQIVMSTEEIPSQQSERVDAKLQELPPPKIDTKPTTQKSKKAKKRKSPSKQSSNVCAPCPVCVTEKK